MFVSCKTIRFDIFNESLLNVGYVCQKVQMRFSVTFAIHIVYLDQKLMYVGQKLATSKHDKGGSLRLV